MWTMFSIRCWLKNLINLFLDQTLLLYTPTFTQQNEHCDWLILGHMPLIKFKCIPTRIQLRNCCPCAEYNSIFLPYDCLRESLNIYNKALNVWSLEKLVSFVFPQVLVFPKTKSRETSGLSEKHSNCFSRVHTLSA